MKLLLIRPNIGRLEHSLFVDEARMEPLQLGMLAGLTPPDVEISLYDDRCEDIPYDEPADLAAITVETFTARRAYEISDEFRKRGVPVILGGMHPTLLPEESALHADSIVTGDAEGCWTEILKDTKQGKLKPRYQAPVGVPARDILPRRDIFRGKGYLPLSLLQFGRGCTNQCSYCASGTYFDHRHYTRDIRSVVREIEEQERKYLFFVDDNIVSDRNAAKELFRALIPLKVRWVSQASIDATEDRELMDLMTRSGCLGNVVGFESLDTRNLEASGKQVNITGAADGYREQLEILKDHGLQTWAAFTLGYDWDDDDSIRRTLDFAMNNKFTFAAFNILMPYPGTEFYRKLEAEGRLLYNGTWWTHPEYRFNHAAYTPARMTAEELTEGGFRCRKTFNSPLSIVRRAFQRKTNMASLLRFGIYLMYAPLFRKETFKKQGMLLGTKA